MKRIFKNASLIAVGLVIGLTANTYGALEKINAYKDNVTSIFVNGKPLNSEELPISYQSRLYVPLRTVGESMNLNVAYDKANKSVFITEKKLTKEEELAKNAKIYEEALAEAKKLHAQSVEEARKEEVKKQETTIDYKALPVKFRQENFQMDLKMVVNENADNNSEFYFDVKNEDQFGYVIDPMSAKFNYTFDRREYELEARNVNIVYFDKRVLSSLDGGYDNKLYLTLPSINKKANQGTLSFNIYKVGESNNITKVIMPIKF